MSNIKNWLSIITNNELHAYNKVNSRDLSICFNFIQIPDTNTVAITVTIMKNKVKKNALDSKSFARVMGLIDEALDSAYYSYKNKAAAEEEHFINVRDQLTDQWYIQLCCHRVFFIPEDSLWGVIENLFHQKSISEMKSNNLDEVSVYVNTDHYDFNGKFY